MFILETIVVVMLAVYLFYTVLEVMFHFETTKSFLEKHMILEKCHAGAKKMFDIVVDLSTKTAKKLVSFIK